MSRPELPIDWEWVDEHLQAGCIGTDIAAKFAMHPTTFYRRVEERFHMSFTQYAQEKKSCGDNLLRKAQFEKALDKDNTMMVWLGKNRLEQRDTPEKVNTAPNDSMLSLLQDLLNENQKLKTQLAQSKTDPVLPGSDPQV
jgi:hypothetical protein